MKRNWMFYWIDELIKTGYFLQLSQRGSEVVCYLKSPAHESFVGADESLEKAIEKALLASHYESKPEADRSDSTKDSD